MRAALRVLTVAVFVGLTGDALAQDLAEPPPRDVRSLADGCGATCVAVFARRAAGRHVSFDRASRIVDPDGDGECTIDDMARGLSSLGIDVAARHRESRELPGFPAILWVASGWPTSNVPDHFIVTEPGRAGQVIVHFPPFGTSSQDPSVVQEMWSGHYIAAQDAAPASWVPRLIAACAIAVVGGVLALAVARRRVP